MHIVRLIAVMAALVVGAAACTGGSEQPEDSTAESVSSEPTTATTAEPTVAVQPFVAAEVPTSTPVGAPEASVFDIVSTLASDELMGRQNRSETSGLAQEFLLDQLELITEPAGADGGRQGYRFDFDRGTNLIGMIRGTDLADQFVVVGAHYDHLGGDCRGISSADAICNGAADNAAGVAAALQVARNIVAQQPRRSVLIALWDAEEDGLLGSRHYVANPVVPLAQTVAYINFDILGANHSDVLSRTTLMIGAESGGPLLMDAALAATAESPLDTATFSLIFGQGRSDHAPFAASAVPIVFFTDATNGCYHTVNDDLAALDFAKLDLQITNATQLAADLVSTDTPPQFDGDAPVTTFDDAISLFGLVAAGEPDFALLGPEGAAESAQLLADLAEIVQAGPDAYAGAAPNTVLLGAAALVERLANGPCLPVGG